jgi:hypothetical protein
MRRKRPALARIRLVLLLANPLGLNNVRYSSRWKDVMARMNSQGAGQYTAKHSHGILMMQTARAFACFASER